VNDPERSRAVWWNFFLRIFPQSSHRVALVGAVLGLGSPGGLFLLRFIFSPSAASWPAWASDEIARLWPVYAYATLGTVAAFSIFGYFLGRGYDAYRGESRALRQMARNLRRLAITDSLTGLYLRSYLLSRLRQEFSRAHRYRSPMSCLFIDVDHFKAFNDRYGHLFGDRILTVLAQAISGAVRDTDLVGRFGGDEFLAILPETDGAAAVRVAERVRAAVAQSVRGLGADWGPVTVSVGVYSPEILPATFDVFLEMSDRALRCAKDAGKNRCFLLKSEEPVSAAEG
jgi:diguanylate cyclase (GGDEF)-like protein